MQHSFFVDFAEGIVYTDRYYCIQKEEDPVFCISDLLVHLSAKQMEKSAATVIEGENLDILIGNRPLEKSEELDKEQKATVKDHIMKL